MNFETLLDWAFGIGIGLVILAVFVKIAIDIIRGDDW